MLFGRETLALSVLPNSDADVSEELKAMYWSLLGATAYALITQFWLSVYVVALQRQTQKPKAIHIRRLNAVVRAV